MNRFMSKLLAIKGECYARRQTETGSHRPVVHPNGNPIVFAVDDAASGHPSWLYSPGQGGGRLPVGRVVAIRTGPTLRVLDLFIAHDLDPSTYLPAVVAYLGIEAGLFGLDRVEIEMGLPEGSELLFALCRGGYQPTNGGRLTKVLGPSDADGREDARPDQEGPP